MFKWEAVVRCGIRCFFCFTATPSEQAGNRAVVVTWSMVHVSDFTCRFPCHSVCAFCVGESTGASLICMRRKWSHFPSIHQNEKKNHIYYFVLKLFIYLFICLIKIVVVVGYLMKLETRWMAEDLVPERHTRQFHWPCGQCAARSSFVSPDRTNECVEQLVTVYRRVGGVDFFFVLCKALDIY